MCATALLRAIRKGIAMPKIRPPRFSVSFPDVPSIEEMRSNLPQLQDFTNQFLRSVSSGWHCRMQESGVLEVFNTSDFHQQLYIRYDANINILYLSAPASCLLDMPRTNNGLSDEFVDKIFAALVSMDDGFSQVQPWLPGGLMLEPVRLVAIERRSAA